MTVGDKSFDELIAELQKASAGNPVEGFTTREIAKAIGTAVGTAQKKLRKLFDEGRIEFSGHRHEAALDGVSRRTNCYRLVKKKAK